MLYVNIKKNLSLKTQLSMCVRRRNKWINQYLSYSHFRSNSENKIKKSEAYRNIVFYNNVEGSIIQLINLGLDKRKVQGCLYGVK